MLKMIPASCTNHLKLYKTVQTDSRMGQMQIQTQEMKE
ncbi:hypothetical protein M107_1464 [Bacteroides fragilis str. 3725 D9(v)]|uniref:Uncharacterized protein n=3 Tax=Bacteroides fragilis TaxID=817 RepID=A0A015TYM5_BACFG|nr:hypothetical protein M118_1715 [Bacteroides fragilis str. 3783N1-2]EXY51499.1 hypothetical protein M121_1688 [Bacteroides fragilis str. 3783N2-1]EXY56296.1 hypothetical protein M122_1642 [Bacteroides fragilis str. 3976T7]EXY84811.1 hypothetical protein M079_1931 [Bacteroides fragilis str. 3996 N(B) 6]EXY87577.1 hypothetical protein M125_5805 [Bacteroides fragilis str. 3998T(B)3]EXY95801.1 hypothetical protein M081_2048 [Bacteroides fragilis str. 3998 T(B) 4]EXZ05790.1 hypothetical protein 